MMIELSASSASCVSPLPVPVLDDCLELEVSRQDDVLSRRASGGDRVSMIRSTFCARAVNIRSYELSAIELDDLVTALLVAHP